MVKVRTKPGIRQTNWCLPEELLNELNEYQHERRLDSLKDAAQKLLEDGLRYWRNETKWKGGE